MKFTTLLKHAATATVTIYLCGLPGSPANALSHDLHAAQRVPRPHHPVVNLHVGPTREVNQIRTTYVEQITARYSYVQYNTGAAQLVRNCRTRNALSCVDPATGTMHLDDGSFVYLAKWAKR